MNCFISGFNEIHKIVKLCNFNKYYNIKVIKYFIITLIISYFAISKCVYAKTLSDFNQKSEESTSYKDLDRLLGEWTLHCIPMSDVNADKEPADTTRGQCEITQTITGSISGKSVQLLELGVSKATDKAGKVDWALVVLTPLDVLLTSDFGLEVGNRKPALFRYRNCNHLGCFAVVPLSKSLIVAMKKANNGAVYFRLLNGQAVKVIFSFKGFDDALSAIESKTANSAARGAPPTLGPGKARK